MGTTRFSQVYVVVLPVSTKPCACLTGKYPLAGGGTKAHRNSQWLAALAERRGARKATVALANKLARIAWNVLVKGTRYQAAA